ncbi:MAG: alpha-E domain-containing protein [Phycisphaerae bacterium]
MNRLLSGNLPALSRVGGTPLPTSALLARVADASYWMSRYLERAEHVARLLVVSMDVLTGAGELDADFALRVCTDVLQITQHDHLLSQLQQNAPAPMSLMNAIARHMTLDEANPNSLISCISKARENARSIRESISAEIWESLNVLYWSFRSEDAAARFDEAPQETCRQVLTGSLLLQGLADQTMDHGQIWLFMQLAKYLERVEMTCRILAAKFTTLCGPTFAVEGPLQVIQWMSVLRSCCCIEAYRRANMGEINSGRVAEFIIFAPSFPRSILFCVQHALEAVDRIRAMLSADAGREAQRQLGLLYAELQYGQATLGADANLAEFLENIRAGTAMAAIAVQDQWFLQAEPTINA